VIFYTYLWLRDDRTPYYVGKGHGERAFVWHPRIGHAPPQDRVLIQEFPSEADSFEAEKFFIAFYGRKDLGTGGLVNRTDGGVGGDTLSPERREQRSLLYRQRGIKPPSRLGKTHRLSQHTREAIKRCENRHYGGTHE
jgi:hypothetical protein